MKEIGIIGFGRFGKTLAKTFKGDFKLFIHDPLVSVSDTSNKSIAFASLKEVLQKESIFISVPIRNFKEIISQITPQLKANQPLSMSAVPKLTL